MPLEGTVPLHNNLEDKNYFLNWIGQEDPTNQIRHTSDINNLVVDKVVQPTWCSDYDLYALRHSFDLFPPAAPSIYAATVQNNVCIISIITCHFFSSSIKQYNV